MMTQGVVMKNNQRHKSCCVIYLRWLRLLCHFVCKFFTSCGSLNWRLLRSPCRKRLIRNQSCFYVWSMKMPQTSQSSTLFFIISFISQILSSIDFDFTKTFCGGCLCRNCTNHNPSIVVLHNVIELIFWFNFPLNEWINAESFRFASSSLRSGLYNPWSFIIVAALSIFFSTNFTVKCWFGLIACSLRCAPSRGCHFSTYPHLLQQAGLLLVYTTTTSNILLF